MQKKFRILTVDSHWLIRSALSRLLIDSFDDVEILEASSYDEVILHLEQDPELDLLLAELLVPGMQGYIGLRKILEKWPELPLVVISSRERREHVMEAVQLGALGYIPKTSSREEVIKGIERVLGGEVAFPRRILQQQQLESSPISDDSLVISIDRLTARQREVFDLLSHGLTNDKIAKTLGLSSNTVRVHIHSILQRLDLESRTQIAMYSAIRKYDAAQTG